MATSRYNEVRIELANLGELFQAPDPDPFSGRPHAESGVDRILNVVRPRRRGAISATIVLPASERAPDLEVRTRAALEDYCNVLMGMIDNNKASLRQEGIGDTTKWALMA